MYIKEFNIVNFGRNYSFSKGINVLTEEDMNVYYALTFLLSFFTKQKEMFNSRETINERYSVKALFEQDNNEFELTRFHKGFIVEDKCTKNKIQVKDFILYQNVLKSTDTPRVYMNNNAPMMKEKNIDYGYNGAYIAKEFISEMFIKKLFFEIMDDVNNKTYQYVLFHCENIKKLMNELLDIVGFGDFNYSANSSRLICKKEKRIYSINQIESVNHLTTMFLELYYLCMASSVDALEEATKTKGIAISWFNFGERPSYSDKKWQYYNFFEKTFPNIQFITV